MFTVGKMKSDETLPELLLCLLYVSQSKSCVSPSNNTKSYPCPKIFHTVHLYCARLEVLLSKTLRSKWAFKDIDTRGAKAGLVKFASSIGVDFLAMETLGLSW